MLKSIKLDYLLQNSLEENNREVPAINDQSPLYIRIWKIVRDVLISSVLFWWVSQPFFLAGIPFGAIFYKENRAFSTNIFLWWEKSGWIKRIAATLFFGIISFPFLIKFGTFLWAAHLASQEITQVLEKKDNIK